MVEDHERHQEILRASHEAVNGANEAMRRARQRLTRINLIYEERMRGKPRAPR